jgi:hypothetical protein
MEQKPSISIDKVIPILNEPIFHLGEPFEDISKAELVNSSNSPNTFKKMELLKATIKIDTVVEVIFDTIIVEHLNIEEEYKGEIIYNVIIRALFTFCGFMLGLWIGSLVLNKY